MKDLVQRFSRPLTGGLSVVVAVTLLVASPAQAGESPTNAVGPDEEWRAAVELLEPHVERSTSDTTFTLTAPPRVIEQVDPEIYAAVTESMAMINAGIESGLLVSRPDLTAVPRAQLSGAESGVAHHGVNNLTCSWVNCTLRLD